VYRFALRQMARIRVEQTTARQAIDSLPFPTAEPPAQVSVALFAAADAWRPVQEALDVAARSPTASALTAGVRSGSDLTRASQARARHPAR
jgi:hypothetical protein